MLFKMIVQRYGAALAGRAMPQHDLIAAALPDTSWRNFRQSFLDDISAARVYVLDAEAADYADSFREEIQNHVFTEAATKKVAAYISEIDLPGDLVWVEHDHAILTADRSRRGHAIDPGYRADDFGLWGFLIDNRDERDLKVSLFRTEGGGSNRIIDPLRYALFSKHPDGTFNYDEFRLEFHSHMLEFYQKAGATVEQIREIADDEANQIGYDVMLAYMVFALIASKESGLLLQEDASLSPSDRKTARKFNKTWMTDILRTHVTIRIGEEARKHLAEQTRRREYEQGVAAGRLSPVEHWVSEHERHYRNGKVVLIRAHRRGVDVDPSIPRKIVGPKRS